MAGEYRVFVCGIEAGAGHAVTELADPNQAIGSHLAESSIRVDPTFDLPADLLDIFMIYTPRMPEVAETQSIASRMRKSIADILGGKDGEC